MTIVAAAPTDEAPPKLGQYVLARELWSGAWSSVWLAADIGRGHAKVTVRRLHAKHLADPAARVRLTEAARDGTKLAHANVLAAREVIDDSNGVAIVSEPFEGQPLSEVLRAAESHGVTIPIPVAVRIALELLAALETAHASTDEESWPEPITPLDLTPENVLVTESGETKLVDLTLERAAIGLRSTLGDSVLGHRAPERFDGKGDHRSDLFAIGVLVWEMLANKRLFVGTDIEEAVRKREIPRLDSPGIRSDPVPAKLAQVVAQALDRQPSRRVSAADHLGQALMSSAGAVASPAEVGALVARVARARALTAPTAKRPELLQTPVVGTVVSPLAQRLSDRPPAPAAAPVPPKPPASPPKPPVAAATPTARKTSPSLSGSLPKPPVAAATPATATAAVAAASPATPPAPRVAPAPPVAARVAPVTAPVRVAATPAPATPAPTAPAHAAPAPVTPAPAPAPPPVVTASVAAPAPAPVVTAPVAVAAPVPVPVAAPAPAPANPGRPVGTVILKPIVTPPAARSPIAPTPPPVAPMVEVIHVETPAAPPPPPPPVVAAPQPVPLAPPALEPPPPNAPTFASPEPAPFAPAADAPSRPLWQQPRVIAAALALAIVAWIVVLGVRSSQPAEPSAAKTPPVPRTAPTPSPTSSRATAAADPAPPSTTGDPPPTDGAGAPGTPGGAVGVGTPRSSGDPPAPSASESKPVPPKRRYNPKSI